MSFQAIGKLQPFLLTISSSAVLLMDLHCHLTKTEVSGYLGGSWDANTHSKYLNEMSFISSDSLQLHSFVSFSISFRTRSDHNARFSVPQLAVGPREGRRR